jgi:hypothetical protein
MAGNIVAQRNHRGVPRARRRLILTFFLMPRSKLWSVRARTIH